MPILIQMANPNRNQHGPQKKACPLWLHSIIKHGSTVANVIIGTRLTQHQSISLKMTHNLKGLRMKMVKVHLPILPPPSNQALWLQLLVPSPLTFSVWLQNPMRQHPMQALIFIWIFKVADGICYATIQPISLFHHNNFDYNFGKSLCSGSLSS
jgi:hypothetical protein